MSRRITPRTTLDILRKEAKRWLKALRDGAADARERLARALPDAPETPTLRTVQHAIAREHGLPGWEALKQLLADPIRAGVPDDGIVHLFLENACPDHHVRGGPAHLRARHTAMRLLQHAPAIAHASFATKVVCGDVAAVAAELAEHPDLAAARSGVPGDRRSDPGGGGRWQQNDLDRDLGAKGWEPLLYVCFTRLPLPAANENAVAIASALLDRGADPNAFFMAGNSRYTPLVGAIGEGEEDRPPHPRRDDLVRLLLDRGAEPYDQQVVYNIHFHGNVLWFLELIHARSLALGRGADWEDREWAMLDMGGYGSGARWHLWIAIEHNDVRLAEWCLAHGANPDAGPARSKHLPQRSLYEEAVRRGCDEIATLLLQYGATRVDVVRSGIEDLGAAAFRNDREAVRTLLTAHPEYHEDPTVMLAAAGRNRADVVELLLGLGISPDVENKQKERPLHRAAYSNALDVARLLIDRGAAIDPVESNWNNTPLAAAIYAQHREMIELLGRYSSDIWELVYAGCIDRVTTLLTEHPEVARAAGGGHTLLMWLPPQDEELALAIATLLLRHGADPSLRNNEGQTAAERADRVGMYQLAALLRNATDQRSRPTMARFEQMAVNLLDAYRTGTPEAMERHWKDTWHRRAWPAMRRYALLDLGRTPAPNDDYIDISLDDARFLVARDQAFDSWQALTEFVSQLPPDKWMIAERPVEVLTPRPRSAGKITRDWDVAIALLQSGEFTGIDAHGQMTDDALERIAHLDSVTTLRLGGSKGLTDAGIRHIARMPQLTHLDLSGTQVTDAGLEVLRQLPRLESISLSWTRVSDGGISQLTPCERLQRVDLAGTGTGDGAIKALAGKSELRTFSSGNGVTDAGIAYLHDFPVFKKWLETGVEASADLDGGPNSLFLRGPFTDRGLAALVGLDGLFGLNIWDINLAITARGLAPLAKLPHLGRLAVEAHDDTMPYIAALPRLRFLMCQDTDATDDGFVALSQSKTIEHIWGRRCHGLRSRGFRALGRMPALRHLSVSCLNVDDEAIATLPEFPTLRELMPMDIPDAGYRHIGACKELESLVLMYCRDTTDAATEQVTGLSKLNYYFNSYTGITDRTPALLATMTSLRRITFDQCHRLTNAGVAQLATLPRLEELRAAGQLLTSDVATLFPASVRVHIGG